MSKIFAVFATVFLWALAGLALAEDAPAPKKEASAAQKAHRERMSTCSKDAKQQGLKGAERKSFMRQCLSEAGGASAQSEAAGQRSQAPSCSKQARAQGLKGEARKTFMKECKAEKASAPQ
jgi:hypothetical protein